MGEINADIQRVTADKLDHSNAHVSESTLMGLTTCVPEPRSHHRGRWTNRPALIQVAVLNNRSRTRSGRGRSLQRLRSERAERSSAHVCESDEAQPPWLRGEENHQALLAGGRCIHSGIAHAQPVWSRENSSIRDYQSTLNVLVPLSYCDPGISSTRTNRQPDTTS